MHDPGLGADPAKLEAAGTHGLDYNDAEDSEAGGVHVGVASPHLSSSCTGNDSRPPAWIHFRGVVGSCLLSMSIVTVPRLSQALGTVIKPLASQRPLMLPVIAAAALVLSTWLSRSGWLGGPFLALLDSGVASVAPPPGRTSRARACCSIALAAFRGGKSSGLSGKDRASFRKDALRFALGGRQPGGGGASSGVAGSTRGVVSWCWFGSPGTAPDDGVQGESAQAAHRLAKANTAMLTLSCMSAVAFFGSHQLPGIKIVILMTLVLVGWSMCCVKRHRRFWVLRRLMRSITFQHLLRFVLQQVAFGDWLHYDRLSMEASPSAYVEWVSCFMFLTLPIMAIMEVPVWETTAVNGICLVVVTGGWFSESLSLVHFLSVSITLILYHLIFLFTRHLASRDFLVTAKQMRQDRQNAEEISLWAGTRAAPSNPNGDNE